MKKNKYTLRGKKTCDTGILYSTKLFVKEGKKSPDTQ